MGIALGGSQIEVSDSFLKVLGHSSAVVVAHTCRIIAMTGINMQHH
jgi:hypothetical protein